MRLRDKVEVCDEDAHGKKAQIMFKQKHKSKEQIIAEKEQAELAKQRKDFIDKSFMPLMESITENIEEAKMLCESTKTAINQAWQLRAGELPLSWLQLKESLDKVKKPELVYKHVKIIECLSGQSIKDAMILLDSLFDEANRAVMKSISSKKLTDFKTDFKNDNVQPSKTA
jgi:hypothetical protein